jgi:hypothetical protein
MGIRKYIKDIAKHVPLIRDFKATDFLKAFTLNALVAAVIAALTVETRLHLDTQGALWADSKETLAETTKLSVTLLTSFVVAFAVYHAMYVLFGYGGGMLIN